MLAKWNIRLYLVSFETIMIFIIYTILDISPLRSKFSMAFCATNRNPDNTTVKTQKKNLTENREKMGRI